MRLVVAAALLSVSLAGCQAVEEGRLPGELPTPVASLDAVLTVQAVAETLAACQADALPRPGTVCHEAELRVANVAPYGEVLLRDGWSIATEGGGVYPARLVSGPVAVVAGGEGLLRIRAAVDDGGRLAAVRWSDAEGLARLEAPAPTPFDPSTLAPPMAVERAELAYGGCRHMGRCTAVTLAVDNRGRDAAFPGPDAAWFFEGTEPAAPWGLRVDGSVPAGEQGSLMLEVDHWMATRVGVAVDGWGLPAFALPEPAGLPVRDEGARLVALDLAQMTAPAANASSGHEEVLLAAMPRSMHDCAPFRGELRFVLERQTGVVLDVEPLWQTVREWTVQVEPGDFADLTGMAWCTRAFAVGDAPPPVQSTYRLRATAVPVATGDEVVGEAWFQL